MRCSRPARRCPVNVVTGTAAFAVVERAAARRRPGVPFYLDDPSVPGGRRFNRAAFTSPPLDASGNPLRQGTLARNALRGFAMSQVDLAVRRDIPLGRAAECSAAGRSLQSLQSGRASGRRPTRSSAASSVRPRARSRRAYGGGGVAGGGLSPLYQVGGPRSVQLALRIQF